MDRDSLLSVIDSLTVEAAFASSDGMMEGWVLGIISGLVLGLIFGHVLGKRGY